MRFEKGDVCMTRGGVVLTVMDAAQRVMLTVDENDRIWHLRGDGLFMGKDYPHSMDIISTKERDVNGNR
jgi:hypothetical protein